MNTVLNINTDGLVKFANRLEKLGKTTLPNVVRKTLNDAAMDVKRVTMPAASNVFTHRQKNFFTGTSRVEFAKNTGNIGTMQSSVGFMDANLKGQNNYSVKDLEQQEDGGEIGGRSYVPLKNARVGGSENGLVKSNLRISILKKKVLFTSKNPKGKRYRMADTHTTQSYWAAKAILTSIAAGVGGFVVDDHDYGGLLWRVDSIRRHGKNTFIKMTKLYAFNKRGKVHVPKTSFMERASDETTRKLERMFITNAEARFNRDLKI